MTGANTASCNRRHHSSCSEVERLSHTQTQRGAPPQPLHKVHYAPLNHRHRRRAGAAFHPESRSSLIPITLAPEVVMAPQRANSMQSSTTPQVHPLALPTNVPPVASIRVPLLTTSPVPRMILLPVSSPT